MSAMTLGVIGCDGGGGHHIDNPTAAGGASVKDGPIDGEVNIFVIDDDTDAPITGADVTIRSAEGSEVPIKGTTDSAGLYTAKDSPILKDSVIITAKAAGHAGATWYGVKGAVVTIPLGSTAAEPSPDTANVSGTIEGFDALEPATNHVFIAVVLASFTDDFGSAENNINQGGSGGLGPNSCLNAGALPVGGPCAWTLKSRTGKQSHYAIIIDNDTKGTFQDQSDDTMTIYGFAIKTGLDLTKGQNVTGETLTMIQGAPVDLTVAFPSLPSGLTQVGAFPIVRLGEDDSLVLAFPGLTTDKPSTKLPPKSGPLASAEYMMFVQASTASGDGGPQSFELVHNIAPGGTVDLGTFMDLPSAIMANKTSGYSFGKVAAATLHTAEIRDTDGTNYWGFASLDGTSTFPIFSDIDYGLPTGQLELHVSGILIDDFKVDDFELTNIFDIIHKGSESFVAFSN